MVDVSPSRSNTSAPIMQISTARNGNSEIVWLVEPVLRRMI
jgi:hypothetical protein